MKDFFEKINPIFSKFKAEKNVEFEMRLGKINKKTFDTNVGKETFEKILKGLKKYKGWESVKEISDTAYYNDKVRLVINDDTGDSTQVIKDKLCNLDHSISGKPFDVRFAVATETPFVKDDMEFLFAKQRTRESFVRKNLSIDMTVVSGNPSDLDNEDEQCYQIEFEIIDPKLVTDVNTLYNIIYKVHDVLELI
jgi:hypothetical protein